MSAKKGKPPIIQVGDVPTIIATGIVAVDRGDGFMDVMFCHDHKWGELDVQERQITGLVHMTMCCWEQLVRFASAFGMTVEMVTPAVH